jgi:hypothetical protein
MIATMLIALAAAAPAQPPATGPDYSGLWTRWSAVNGDALRAETARQAPTAPSGPLRAGSAELGTRVGEIVRGGDCEEGERVARAAGDFPLVEAVRAHCRTAVPAVSRDPRPGVRTR